MQDIMDDDETENVYIPNDEADSTLYYDTEASLVHLENIDTSANIEENNNVPHSDIPTDMIQLNDSVTVSTVTVLIPRICSFIVRIYPSTSPTCSSHDVVFNVTCN